jgi:hypothetical protein
MIIMKNKIQWTLAVLALFGIGLFSSCYPNDDISDSETDIVATNYVDTVDFSRIQTYFLPDTVFPIKAEDDTTTYEKNPYTDQIISKIAGNMSDYGYQRITNPDTNNVPDVVVYASSITSTSVSVWYPYYPGWDYWWGYPGWG